MKVNDYAIFTIKVNRETKKRLESLKIHPREPFNDVIQRLLKSYDKQKEKKE